MTTATHYALINITSLPGSTKMISMHEALARERMYESHREARLSRVANQMAAARRWRRLERIARSVHQRHARSAADAAAVICWD